ncbi:hypothetical protein EYV96_08010 [Dyella terrae]|uniref:Uncharacterized protein n=2 Tax=Dyella TaxID=231454 RepID=A0A4R0YSV5_9GAMM|nr:hypothetical protein EYV96_08010 [Dyella terrae]TCI12312.1 hypothetical protein EZM97_02860 [Dyella soli]
MRFAALAVATTALLAACSERPLRGSIGPSPDGKTYLAVVDDNGGSCGPMKVDGQVWGHRIGEVAPIEPGRHTIECGGSITFEIPHGVVFRFDYWGP